LLTQAPGPSLGTSCTGARYTRLLLVGAQSLDRGLLSPRHCTPKQRWLLGVGYFYYTLQMMWYIFDRESGQWAVGKAKPGIRLRCISRRAVSPERLGSNQLSNLRGGPVPTEPVTCSRRCRCTLMARAAFMVFKVIGRMRSAYVECHVMSWTYVGWVFSARGGPSSNEFLAWLGRCRLP
jgi:hypothetical protein